MEDQPYTTADEDPFNVRPVVQQVKTIKHRRSSMLDKWILEQQSQSTESPDALQLPKPYLAGTDTLASSSNPYLAYPDLPRVTREQTRIREEVESINSYDLVEDDDIPPITFPADLIPEAPLTPVPQRTKDKHSRHSLTPSFRNLNLAFRPNSPLIPPTRNAEASSSRRLSRLSFFPRTPHSTARTSSETTTPQNHNRSSSLSTLNLSTSVQSTKAASSSVSSRWRPSVLGHFQQQSSSQSSILVSETQYTPSRPSISSNDTYNTSTTSRTTTTLDSNIPTTPSKISLFDSIRLRTLKSSGHLSAIPIASASLTSIRLPTPSFDGNLQEPSRPRNSCQSDTLPRRTPFAPKPGSMLDNVEDDEDDLDPPATFRPRPGSTRPSIPYPSGGTLPRVKFSSLNGRSQRKKKRLVISGVGVGEVRKFEGVKRWCESFGDVRQITRTPNGDLHVDFRDPEVADTVCRVRAKVYIAGVGSVQLSWFAGTKR
ncbi:hypothetical protein B0H34DRAFT_792379 [Crassisporium funariophilum]|nr:hypothetical protein B0H34DRAFT_792379 [Crassisporium funariophilum]